MNIVVTTRQAKFVATAMSMGFMLIHVAMIALFSLCGVVPMVWFNAFSILFYLGSLVLVSRQHYRTYMLLVYLEVTLHMALAIGFVGWDAGFHIPLLGMAVVAFFFEYLGRSMRAPHVPGAPLAMVNMATYVAMCVYSHTHEAPYVLAERVTFWLQIGWGVTVFVIMTAFLKVFVLVTFESERMMFLQLTHDKLTGLPNRYHMSDYLKQIEEKGQLGSHWIAMIDIDDFKAVNDVYGHNCGDYVLSEMAKLLTSARGTAEVCRWGGEEFLMVGEIGNGMDEQVQLLDKLRQTVEDYGFWYEEQRLRVTITVGVATYPAGVSVHEWINQADKRLYEGKTSGKNRVVA